MTEKQRIDARKFDRLFAVISRTAIPGRRNRNRGLRIIGHLGSLTHDDSPNTSLPRKGPTLKGMESTKTILLVEDEEVLGKLVTEVLASNGYKVLIAEDGEQAARVFSHLHSNISLVLSDVHLPKIGGDRLLRIMRKIDPQVPVVFESGYFDAQLKSRLLRSGAQGFIQKPQVPGEILTKIRDVLSDRR